MYPELFFVNYIIVINLYTHFISYTMKQVIY